MIYSYKINLLSLLQQNLTFGLIIFLFMVTAYGFSENVMSAPKESAKKQDIQLNLTYSEIADVLRAKGYNVNEYPGQSPVVYIGDITYPAEVILSNVFSGRASNIVKTRLWVKDGVAQSWYFYDTASNADKNVFEGAVKTWADKTCIIFTKLADGPCTKDPGHGAICVGSYGGCHSNVGNLYPFTKKIQQMSVKPNGCELVAAAHEFGHALGFYHQQSRPDRDKFINVRHEHFEVKINERKNQDILRGHSHQGGKCSKDQTQDFPLPFDYMSLMMYKSAAFGDSDCRAVFVAKDGHHQYIIDYHRPAGLTQSHYDLYMANVAYGCENKWKAKCQKNGKNSPKCANLGYVGKDCKCKCPDGFSGATCATKGDTIYPVLPKAHMLDVTEPKVIDLATFKYSLEKEDGVLDEFKHFQFFTIVVKADEKMLAVIDMIQNQEASTVIPPIIHNFFVMAMYEMDCVKLVRLYWGVADKFQLRTECLSQAHNFELVGPHFRSWSNMLDFIYKSSVGTSAKAEDATVKFMAFKLNVTFHLNPAKILAVKEENPNPAGFSGGFSTALASAEHMVLSVTLIGAIVGGLVLLIVIGCVIYACKGHKHHGHHSGSESDSDTDSSD